jgi:hypothetical protein
MHEARWTQKLEEFSSVAEKSATLQPTLSALCVA